MPRRPKPSGRKLPDKGKPVQSRSVRSREKPPHFLIVCEGEETEVRYFESFKVDVNVQVIGTGFNTEALVAYTKKLQSQAAAEERPYKNVWVVFDRDSFPPDDFNNAIEQARKAGFCVAYSNEAFELWYILHYDFLNTGVTRSQYKKMLTQRLLKPYKKNDPTTYYHLQENGNQGFAIQNAIRLLNDYQPNHNPANDNPCTTVFELVMELNEHLV